MESAQSTSTITATDRINSALATLKSDMIDLRQQDVQLLKQLMCINENIQKLTKRKGSSSTPLRKKLALVNGRMNFVNIDESITDKKNHCIITGHLSGSLASIEDSSNSAEDLSSADSDSDDSICGTTLSF
ncbi:uncharacterized protein LOC110447666 [Mizuhopecten yessoensis]|uniref:uncharacterized protein LOC110447666 n=1 Tax=Mizuhopecten yessoensis TaxID=6573 RepID=UPI000B457848|nr:uncharacterized protein LOC110447666 [Mizuhopecten yessoensis]